MELSDLHTENKIHMIIMAKLLPMQQNSISRPIQPFLVFMCVLLCLPFIMTGVEMPHGMLNVHARPLEPRRAGGRQLQVLDGDASVCNHSVLQGGPVRSDFPPNFIFGTATSAAQVEGAALVDGRSDSIWDKYATFPGKIKDGSTPRIADDQYHKYKDDMGLVNELGADSYRFSVSWSRVISADGSVNKQGINYYNEVIDTLVSLGIKPALTLYHWDLPSYLEDRHGGWLNPDITRFFIKYADLCFKHFGDRVKLWITFNEPGECAIQGYGTGGMAPGRCTDRTICSAGLSSEEPYIVAHNMLRSHARAVDLYRRVYQKAQGGRIGITLDTQYLYPIDNSSANIKAAERGMQFSFGWFADPVETGDYPASMRSLVGERLPQFDARDKQLLTGSADFLGLNFYTASFAWEGAASAVGLPWTDSGVNTSSTNPITGDAIGASTASPWLKVVPSGIHDILLWITNRYPNVSIIITENGSSDPNDPSISLDEALCDTKRVQYYKAYLKNVAQAIKKGANVEGYYAWSLLDNWEWSQGFTQRFGLFFVNFTDPSLPRVPKLSVSWWKGFLSS